MEKILNELNLIYTLTFDYKENSGELIFMGAAPNDYDIDAIITFDSIQLKDYFDENTKQYNLEEIKKAINKNIVKYFFYEKE